MAATTPPKKKLSAGEIAKKSRPARKKVRICIAGDLAAEHERLVEELERLLREPAAVGARLAGVDEHGPEVIAAAEQIRQLEDEMAEETYDFVFVALPAKKWSDLLAEHPDPKKERMFEPESFVPAAIAASCIEPEGMDDPEQVAAVFDALSAGQQSELFEAAWEVNQAGPFAAKTSSLASAVLRPSATSSSSAADEGSPAASS